MKMEPVQVRLTEKLKEKLDREVDRGTYPTRSEAVRSAIRNLVTPRKEGGRDE